VKMSHTTWFIVLEVHNTKFIVCQQESLFAQSRNWKGALAFFLFSCLFPSFSQTPPLSRSSPLPLSVSHLHPFSRSGERFSTEGEIFFISRPLSSPPHTLFRENQKHQEKKNPNEENSKKYKNDSQTGFESRTKSEKGKVRATARNFAASPWNLEPHL
jgi:hypothetical protein